VIQSTITQQEPSQSNGEPKNRIAYLDGLRAVAILMVVLFHYYYLFPSSVEISYGKAIGEFMLFKYGYLGVMLFFSISGFVISQTLHGSNKPINFVVKRFSRLFPAMLVCSALTYVVSLISPQTYHASFYNFLPSLTFLDPRIFNFIFRTDGFSWMDEAYWSLFTEIRFYTIAAIVFFTSKEKFHRNFLILALAIGVAFPVAIYFQITQVRSGLNFFFIANELPWFVFGIGCYYLHLKHNYKAAAYTLVSFLCLSFYILAITEKPYMPFDGTATFIGALIIFSLIFCAIKIRIVSNVLSFKPLTAVGIASYSLYLLHQEIGQKIIQVIDSSLSPDSAFAVLSPMIPIFTLTAAIIFSLFLYRLYESPVNKRLNAYFNMQARVDLKTNSNS
jgi:peptidoglycan/LPS O-acetylase OafA/YrhL